MAVPGGNETLHRVVLADGSLRLTRRSADKTTTSLEVLSRGTVITGTSCGGRQSIVATVNMSLPASSFPSVSFTRYTHAY